MTGQISRRKPFSVFFIVLVLSVLSVPDGFGQSPPKPRKEVFTVRGDAAKSKPDLSAAPKTFGLTVEKYVSSYRINTDSTVIQHLEIQQKCSTEACLRQLAKAKYEFNGDLHDIRLIEAFIVKASGKKVVIDVSSLASRPTPQAEAAPGFSSLREIEIAFEGLEINDSAYYKAAIETRRPLFDNHFDSIELFPQLYEWKSIEINVDAPRGYQLQFEPTGLQGGEAASQGDRSRWRWQTQNAAAIPLEAAMFDSVSKGARLIISTFRSYEDLGRAFWQGVKRKAIVTPEIRSLADEITKDIVKPEDQIAAIYNWANKNVRYLAVILDRGGYVPHSSEEIVRNRYGDCKDYTTIIYTLLKAKGIESVPALIRSDLGSWFPSVASTEYFNHAILYIPSLKLFADATAPNTRLGILSQTLAGKKALLASETSGFVEVPKDTPDDNQILSEVEINISENGDLKAVSKNRYVGRAEILVRPVFGSIASGSDVFMKLMFAYLGVAGTGRIAHVSDPHKVGEPFEVHFEAELKDWTTFLPKGKFEMPIGLNMFTLSDFELLTKDESRRTDLYAGALRMRESYRIQVPASVKTGELPAAQYLSNEIGEFRMEFKRANEKIELHRELILKKDAIAPTEYPAFREIVKTAVESLNASITYTAPKELLQAKSRQIRKQPRPAASTTKGVESIIEGLFELNKEKLTAAQARRLETKLLTEPGDLDSRLKLINHYSRDDLKETPTRAKARTNHRLWFVKNRPQMDDLTVMRVFNIFAGEDSSEYRIIRDEWTAQVAKSTSNKRVRLNAVSFIRAVEPKRAEELLRDGIAIDENAFEFQAELAGLLIRDYKDESKSRTSESQDTLVRSILATGRTALSVLKRERSQERDEERAKLLISLCPIAFEAGETEWAETLAQELILDFGNDVNESNFEKATHIGNVVIGNAQLSKGNKTKAVEHLLISIRAPLRDKTGYFTDIDTSLAKGLLKLGEKTAVSEFLKLCLELNAFKSDTELYADELAAIKKWQTQIEQNIEPSFDFNKP